MDNNSPLRSGGEHHGELDEMRKFIKEAKQALKEVEDEEEYLRKEEDIWHDIKRSIPFIVMLVFLGIAMSKCT